MSLDTRVQTKAYEFHEQAQWGMYRLSAGVGFVCRQEPEDGSGSQTPTKDADESSDQKDASGGTGEKVEGSQKPFPLFGAKFDVASHEFMHRDSFYSRESYENLVSILNNDGEKPQTHKERPIQSDSSLESDM